MMEQLTNEQIDATVQMIETLYRWSQINKAAADAALAVCAQAKASNITDPILTRLDLIGELTSPEYISRLRGVMGEGGVADKRRDGHSALRLGKDGELERFDPHPPKMPVAPTSLHAPARLLTLADADAIQQYAKELRDYCDTLPASPVAGEVNG